MTPETGPWGGKRRGAGRPKAEVCRLKDVMIPREVWALFEQLARQRGIPAEALVAEVLTAYATAPLFAASPPAAR